MVKTHLLQKAIVTKLKANSALVAELADSGQVKENQFQGTIFSYPAVRVDIDPQTPIGNGIDHVKLSDVQWRVRCYSEKDSSFQANKIAGLVMDALFYGQISGTDENNVDYLRVIRVDVINVGNPIRLAEKLWMAEITFSGVAHPVAPLLP